MSLGPGRYDNLCTYAREQAKAQCALVIIMGGDKGNGFSMQTANLLLLAGVPDLLRDIARQIEESYGKS